MTNYISENDQHDLFSELFKIAIGACIHSLCDNPIIILKTKKHHKRCIIKMSFTHNLKEKLDLKKIKEIVQENNGRVTIDFDDETHFQYANIFIMF